jgi:DNA helicase HerA-like ATPase
VSITGAGVSSADMAGPPDVEAQLAQYRAVRRQLEEAILPLAGSVDGRRFSLQSSLHGLAFEVGGYVVLESEDGGRRFGQVLSLAATSVDGPEAGGDGMRTRVMLRAAEGEGIVLGGDAGPFHDALARPASAEEIASYLAEVAPHRARLVVGEVLLAPGVPLALDGGGFDRHTFLCGQSGSGKTYGLGVLLERLLHETDLRIVILDPNSDFVRLGETREGADPALAARHAEVAAGVVARRAEDEDRLRLALPDLDAPTQAAMLRLDPIADREEYAALTEVVENFRPGVLEDLPDDRLGQRVRNLGVGRWGIWSRGQAGSVVDDVLEGDARCLVVDLGSLGMREEQALAATAVLTALWRDRERRRPVLVVIDEAHNVCPAEPDDPLRALSTDVAVRIAAEGRKFGLYLLVSTQRPQKIPENLLSQCDNLVLMRMNSQADLAYVGEVFSFVPPSLLARATAFRQGECLVAGKIAPHPGFLRVGERVSVEGGGDVAADWARPRA